MPSLLALIELFREPIPDLPGVGVALLDVLRAGMDNDAARRPDAGKFRDQLAALPLTDLGVATTSVFAQQRASVDDATVNWASETQTAPPPYESLSMGRLTPADPSTASHQ